MEDCPNGNCEGKAEAGKQPDGSNQKEHCLPSNDKCVIVQKNCMGMAGGLVYLASKLILLIYCQIRELV